MIPNRRIVSLTLLLALCWLPIHAQVRTTGEIRGTVSDPSGAVVAGAQLSLRDQSTGVERTAVSGTNGAFVFLNLQAGPYDLTVSAQGFQKGVYTNLQVETARTLDLPLQLTVGAITQTVEVADVAPVLETTSNTLSTTVGNEALVNLPLSGRAVLAFALLSAGAQTIGSSRDSTFNGLPNASLNISLDGMNNNSQRFKTGGTSFFEFATARLGAIEEVTVTTAGTGSDAAGGGAMSMRFVTKRGTNKYHGSVFEQFRNDALNANSFFNNARNIPIAKLRLNEFGGNFGGPLPIPFVPALKGKLFFFLNYETQRQPTVSLRSATVLTADARNGFFSYIGTDNQVHRVNVLQIGNGTVDPTVSGLLNTIAGSESKAIARVNSSTDLIRDTIQWNEPSAFSPKFPTARLDHQVTRNINWHGAWNLRWQHNDPFPNYPGLPTKGGEYVTTAYVASVGTDWTIKPSLINTFNFGIQSNYEVFDGGRSIHDWTNQRDRRITLGTGLSPVIADNVPFIRNNPVYSLTDNLSWVHGKHTFTFGGTTLYTNFYETTWGSAGVLTYTLGIATGDPVSAQFNTTSMPAIRTTDIATATGLFATLTGRLSGISGSRNVDEISHDYKDFAPLTWRQAQRTGGIYIQDSFRWSPQLTLNYGFRWEFSGAQHNTNGIYTSPTYDDLLGPSRQLFKPGVLDGNLSPAVNQRSYPYKGDFVNPAPNLGFAWNPDFGSGILGKLLGSNRKTVIRGGYGVNFYDEGLNNIQAFSGNNVGIRQTVAANPGDPGFALGGLSLTSNPPPFTVFPSKFAFPLPQSLIAFNSALSTTKPELRTPYVQSWSLGVQRELTKNTVLEVRYVGNKATHVWHSYSLNEINIFENGFLPEFVNAQKNLAINRAANVTSFANLGRPGQVALPIFDAAFGARGSQAALLSASGYTNGTFINQLDLGSAGGMAGSLSGSQTYFCRMVGSNFGPCSDRGYNAAGPYPINFFRPNPYPTNITLLDDNSFSTYHALQMELRRNLSKGFWMRMNYTFSKTLSDLFVVDQNPTKVYATQRNRKLDKGPAPFDLRHVFLTNFTYELPFGRGHRFSSSHGLLNRAIGGWTLGGIFRASPGRVYKLTSGRSTVNGNDPGVILNGITLSQLQEKMTALRPGPASARNLFFADASLVGSDGRANPNVLQVPTTPGQFGQFLYLHGPKVFTADISLTKETPITERVVFTLQVEALNAFNHPVFQAATIPSLTGGSGALSIDSTSFGQTAATVAGINPRNIQLRALIRF